MKGQQLICGWVFTVITVITRSSTSFRCLNIVVIKIVKVVDMISVSVELFEGSLAPLKVTLNREVSFI